MKIFTKEVKEIIAFVSFCILSIYSFALSGCSCKTPSNNFINVENTIEYQQGFSVHFLDVGQGDCIFIHFPDGKNMLIDCGSESEDIVNYINSCLNVYSVKDIDYLVLTHPENDHVGNAISIINEYNVKSAYITKINNLENFAFYAQIIDKLIEEQAQINYSQIFKNIINENCSIMFLSPMPLGFPNSSLSDLNQNSYPSTEQKNNVSPIMFLEYNGVKFLFTGDAGVSQEQLVLSNYKANLYKNYSVSLEDIDFLKVAHHGSNDSCSGEFLSLIKPKNAIISVGGDNIFGHPSSEVLERLQNANKNYNLFRTDRDGSVSVFVDEMGKVNVECSVKKK